MSETNGGNRTLFDADVRANDPSISGRVGSGKAPRNRTLACSDSELAEFSKQILEISAPITVPDITNQAVRADIFQAAQFLPRMFVDLLILDPPYNLSKNYNGNLFKAKAEDEYRLWFDKLMDALIPTLKPQATIYVCADWRTSTLIFPVLSSKFYVQNRITWERDKGRGAKSNWKNNTEDIWFCTHSKAYYFDVDSVKLKRKVIAPYRENGKAKDWVDESNGKFRLTYPSNVWTDITVPFWSMSENTDHPTQKPEKLMAKLILASSKANDFVFDPFLGSGTTAVVSTKLQRRWSGIEINQEYLCWALKRVKSASESQPIQGYKDNIFWERNSLY